MEDYNLKPLALLCKETANHVLLTGFESHTVEKNIAIGPFWILWIVTPVKQIFYPKSL